MALKESSSKQAEAVTFEVADRKTTFEPTRLTILVFIFVFVRGPLFRIEDLTNLGYHRVYVWRTVRSLVRAGILEKFDRKSYGATVDARRWFRTAFGGGVNDAAFAYSAMVVESWSESRLEYFKTRLTEMWKERPDRIKVDPARVGSTSNQEDYRDLIKILCEKMEEASCVCSLLEKSADHQSSSGSNKDVAHRVT